MQGNAIPWNPLNVICDTERGNLVQEWELHKTADIFPYLIVGTLVFLIHNPHLTSSQIHNIKHLCTNAFTWVQPAQGHRVPWLSQFYYIFFMFKDFSFFFIIKWFIYISNEPRRLQLLLVLLPRNHIIHIQNTKKITTCRL